MTKRLTYEAALTEANQVGSSHASDAGLMAQLCDSSLQLLVGAASPKLVWEGAQKKGMSAADLMALANSNPLAVHDLMWI